MPMVLKTLNDELSTPVNQVDVDRLVRTISYDKSLVAQCLRMANSALYRQRGDVNTVGEAVLSLGILRIRDLVFSCTLPQMFTSLNGIVPKEVFWRHALGTALVAQALNRHFSDSLNEDIYVAGLLHDIGVLVNALLFPEDFQDIMKLAVTEGVPVSTVERHILGFTHAESGRILADSWKLALDVSSAIECHHQPELEVPTREGTFLVYVADQFCLSSTMGYGYQLREGEVATTNQLWHMLCDRLPRARRYDFEAVETMLLSTLHAAAELADRVFGQSPSGSESVSISEIDQC